MCELDSTRVSHVGVPARIGNGSGSGSCTRKCRCDTCRNLTQSTCMPTRVGCADSGRPCMPQAKPAARCKCVHHVLITWHAVGNQPEAMTSRHSATSVASARAMTCAWRTRESGCEAYISGISAESDSLIAHGLLIMYQTGKICQ